MNRSGYLDVFYDNTYTVADISNTANGYVRGVLPPAAAGSVATTGTDFFKTSTWNRRTSFAKIHTSAVNSRVDIDLSAGALAAPVVGSVITVRIKQFTNDGVDPVTTEYSYTVANSATWPTVATALQVKIAAAGYTATNPTATTLRIIGSPFEATAVNCNGVAFTVTTQGKFAQGTSAEIARHYLNDSVSTINVVDGHVYDIISIDCSDDTDSLYNEGSEYKKVRFIIDATAANGQALSAEIVGYFTGINSL
jgi:hypothetical protein